MELRRIDNQIAIARAFNCIAGARDATLKGRGAFAYLGNVGSDVNESLHFRIGSSFGDDLAAVTMADQHDRTVLHGNHSTGRLYVIRETGLGLLDDADFEALLNESIKNRLPARTIGKSAVDEDDVVNRISLCDRDNNG